MNAFTKVIVVFVLGILSFAAVGALCLFLDHKIGFSAMSFSILFVIPVGAIIAGIIGSLGFYLSTTAVHFRPAGWLWAVMPLIAMVTYVGIYYGEYKLETFPDGTQVSDQYEFVDYMHASIKAVRVGRLKSSNSAEAGSFGYVIFAANFLGFIGASMLMAFVMANLPYCKTCERYYDPLGEREILFPTREAAIEFRVNHIKHAPFSKEYVESFETKSPAEEGKALSRFIFKVEECKQCKAQHVTEILSHYDGKDWSKDYDTEVMYEGKRGERRLTLT